ncbi:MAG: hypothetical protein ACOCW5_04800 [Spirochaetia bacterium]
MLVRLRVVSGSGTLFNWIVKFIHQFTEKLQQQPVGDQLETPSAFSLYQDYFGQSIGNPLRKRADTDDPVLRKTAVPYDFCCPFALES